MLAVLNYIYSDILSIEHAVHRAMHEIYTFNVHIIIHARNVEPGSRLYLYMKWSQIPCWYMLYIILEPDVLNFFPIALFSGSGFRAPDFDETSIYTGCGKKSKPLSYFSNF